MDKVTIRLDRQLQHVSEHDEEFRNLRILPNAHLLIAWLLGVASTGVLHDRPFGLPSETMGAVSGKAGLLDPTPEDLALLRNVYYKSDRIAVELQAGTVESCVGIWFTFYPPGRNAPPIMILEGYADSLGVGYLRLKLYEFD